MSEYTGPDFEIDGRYATILKLVFVVMMYGPGMPILYPIAFISLLILYVIDRISLLYVNKRPPEYDGVLNQNALDTLNYAPLLGLGFSYWMFSN